MLKEKEEILEELREIKKTAEKDIKKNHPGYENCVIKDVIDATKENEEYEGRFRSGPWDK